MTTTHEEDRWLAVLRWALLATGVFAVFALPFVIYAFPDGWRWHPYNVKYEHMIISIYFAMGLFLMLVHRSPRDHGAFVWFCVVANAAHGLVMLAHALHDPQERANLTGDTGPLLVGTAALALLAWKARVPLGAPKRTSG